MLQASPALTHLKLTGVVLGEESSESYPVVSLPLLQSIYIAQSSAEACYLVLCHLTIPPCARLSVEGWNIYGGDELTGLLVPICQHLRAPSASPIRRLRFDYTTSNPNDGERNFTISTSTADEDRSLFSITTHPLSDTSLPHIITKVLEMLADLQPGITHLDCRSTSTAPQLTTLKAWKTAISLLPALDIVYIPPNVTAIRVLQALSQLAETPAVGDASPCLREIRITGLSDKEGFNAMPLVLNGLRQLLSFLNARGTPLERLEVSKKSTGLEVDEEGWKSLSQLVGTFVRSNDV
ncbi:hypothetical protein DFH08DRAFT_1051309 [Mycena albidolilacea]|uniref:Uncharacterized protein n=1 Tax=Mycena albidolilacea TaxID=1033008 RepID=A0AAD6Z4S9_9AGAR|nr:hypothetical protein DFH08DRAFT_1051309 [Mycena albidolilacea]